MHDSLDLLGEAGDRVQLAIEAAGYERTGIEVTLDGGAHTVELKESGRPLFIQRLTPVARSIAIPNDAAVMRAVDGAAAAAPMQ